jgi:hypothetical protein
MKRLFTIILSAFFMAGCHPVYAQQIITATVTFTNTAGTANSNTFTLNGVTRNFTNYIQNYQQNILASNTVASAASNFFLAYITYAKGSVVVSQTTVSNINFMSYPSSGLAASLSPGWGKLTWFTNYITNSIVVRVPKSSVGIYDMTNIANGLVDFLNDNAVTNPFSSSAPAFANLASSATIIAYSLLNTNFTLYTSNQLKNFTLAIGLQGTNFSQSVSNWVLGLFTAYNIPYITAWPNGPAFQSASYYQGGSLVLSNIITDYPLGIPANIGYDLPVSVVGGYGNDIGLIQTNHDASANNGPNYDPNAGASGNSITRLDAFYGDSFDARFEDGDLFLQADTSHNVEVYDHASTIRWQMFDARGGSPAGGNAWSGSGNILGMNESANGYFQTLYPITANTPQFPIVLSGTATNFWGELTNGDSGTEVDNYTIPAYTMTNNGDCLSRTIGILFSSGASLKQVDIYFDGYQIFTTSTLTTTSGGSLSIVCEVTRISSTSYAFNCYAVGSGIGSTTGLASVNTHSTTFTADISNCYINLTASSTGAAAGQITVVSDNTVFRPAAAWQGVQ